MFQGPTCLIDMRLWAGTAHLSSPSLSCYFVKQSKVQRVEGNKQNLDVLKITHLCPGQGRVGSRKEEESHRPSYRLSCPVRCGGPVYNQKDLQTDAQAPSCPTNQPYFRSLAPSVSALQLSLLSSTCANIPAYSKPLCGSD